MHIKRISLSRLDVDSVLAAPDKRVEFLLEPPNAWKSLRDVDKFDATDIARRSKTLQVTGYILGCSLETVLTN